MNIIKQTCVECFANELHQLPEPWNNIAECARCGHPNDIIDYSKEKNNNSNISTDLNHSPEY